jgi:nucleoside-diphosphate-sugar epimerase
MLGAPSGDGSPGSAGRVDIFVTVSSAPAAAIVPQADERRRVHVTGAEGNLGSRVLVLLDANPTLGPGSATANDVVVHLGAGDHDLRARRRESVTAGATVMLRDATVGGATHLVLVSSALVYGAYANNPIPLTEDAVLRPDVEFVYARQLATVEAMADRWRRTVPGRTVAVLRPAVAMAADGTSSLARALAAGLGQRFGEDDPPAQFLHLDDLASAVALAVDQRLDGVFNVAPDGWIAGERVRALTGSRPRVRLPDRVNEVLGRVRWRFQRGPIPPGLRSYTRAPWLVANDRLKARGWRPTVTNEQAYVEGTEARWWTMITPKRRQELSLAGMVLTAVGLASVALAVVAAWRRRRRR